MAARCFLVYFMLTSYAYKEVVGQAPQYGGKGKDMTLSPTIPGKPETMVWKHHGNRVVEFDGSEQTEYDRYNGRVILDWHSADLTIRDLKKEDNGLYELEIKIGQKLYYSHHNVEVLDEVSEPTISCVIEDRADTSQTKAMLVCSAGTGGPVSLMKYKWKQMGVQHASPNLSISVKGKDDNTEYVCGVSNPVSDKSSRFIAKDCYSDERISTALIAGVVVSITLIFLAILLCWLCYRKRRKGLGKALKDVEKAPFIDNSATLPSKQSLARLAPNVQNLNQNDATIEQDETEKLISHTPEQFQDPPVEDMGALAKLSQSLPDQILPEPQMGDPVQPIESEKNIKEEKEDEEALPPSPVPCDQPQSPVTREESEVPESDKVQPESPESTQDNQPHTSPQDSEEGSSFNESEPHLRDPVQEPPQVNQDQPIPDTTSAPGEEAESDKNKEEEEEESPPPSPVPCEQLQSPVPREESEVLESDTVQPESAESTLDHHTDTSPLDSEEGSGPSLSGLDSEVLEGEEEAPFIDNSATLPSKQSLAQLAPNGQNLNPDDSRAKQDDGEDFISQAPDQFQDPPVEDVGALAKLRQSQLDQTLPEPEMDDPAQEPPQVNQDQPRPNTTSAPGEEAESEKNKEDEEDEDEESPPPSPVSEQPQTSVPQSHKVQLESVQPTQGNHPDTSPLDCEEGPSLNESEPHLGIPAQEPPQANEDQPIPNRTSSPGEEAESEKNKEKEEEEDEESPPPSPVPCEQPQTPVPKEESEVAESDKVQPESVESTQDNHPDTNPLDSEEESEPCLSELHLDNPVQVPPNVNQDQPIPNTTSAPGEESESEKNKKQEGEDEESPAPPPREESEVSESDKVHRESAESTQDSHLDSEDGSVPGLNEPHLSEPVQEPPHINQDQPVPNTISAPVEEAESEKNKEEEEDEEYPPPSPVPCEQLHSPVPREESEVSESDTVQPESAESIQDNNPDTSPLDSEEENGPSLNGLGPELGDPVQEPPQVSQDQPVPNTTSAPVEETESEKNREEEEDEESPPPSPVPCEQPQSPVPREESQVPESDTVLPESAESTQDNHPDTNPLNSEEHIVVEPAGGQQAEIDNNQALDTQNEEQGLTTDRMETIQETESTLEPLTTHVQPGLNPTPGLSKSHEESTTPAVPADTAEPMQTEVLTETPASTQENGTDPVGNIGEYSDEATLSQNSSVQPYSFMSTESETGSQRSTMDLSLDEDISTIKGDGADVIDVETKEDRLMQEEELAISTKNKSDEKEQDQKDNRQDDESTMTHMDMLPAEKEGEDLSSDESEVHSQVNLHTGEPIEDDIQPEASDPKNETLSRTTREEPDKAGEEVLPSTQSSSPKAQGEYVEDQGGVSNSKGPGDAEDIRQDVHLEDSKDKVSSETKDEEDEKIRGGQTRAQESRELEEHKTKAQL